MWNIRSQYSCRKQPIAAIVLFFSTFIFASSCFCQFADLPQDAKTVDIGFSGDDALQTLTLTSVMPLKNINGWAGVFGSRGTGKEGVITEIAKGRIQGGVRIKTFGIELFTDFERNISKGTALTFQIGSYIRPGIYENGTLRISGGIGYFLENVQPHKNLTIKKFDPTQFRWLGFTSIGWENLNVSMKYSPEVGFRNFKYSAEPAFSIYCDVNLAFRVTVEWFIKLQ